MEIRKDAIPHPPDFFFSMTAHVMCYVYKAIGRKEMFYLTTYSTTHGVRHGKGSFG